MKQQRGLKKFPCLNLNLLRWVWELGQVFTFLATNSSAVIFGSFHLGKEINYTRIR